MVIRIIYFCCSLSFDYISKSKGTLNFNKIINEKEKQKINHELESTQRLINFSFMFLLTEKEKKNNQNSKSFLQTLLLKHKAKKKRIITNHEQHGTNGFYVIFEVIFKNNI